MKVLLVSLVSIAVLCLFFFVDSDAMPEINQSFILQTVDPTDDSNVGEGFAVVELFTSEGCSSCPPADKVLNSIAAEADESGRPVYALAFHVDYWNGLGWKDPFSSSAYSVRQRSYAKAMGTRNVYTPQMVVNGNHELIGSDKQKAVKAIAEALQTKDAVHLELALKDHKSTGGKEALVVMYSTDKADVALLNLALVESNLVTEVPHGENAGRTLRHDNVVRSFITVNVDKDQTDGEVVLPLPEGIVWENCSVIGYVQEPTALKILGATSMSHEY